jgi:hypothetical protein
MLTTSIHVAAPDPGLASFGQNSLSDGVPNTSYGRVKMSVRKVVSRYVFFFTYGDCKARTNCKTLAMPILNLIVIVYNVAWFFLRQ